MRDARGSEAVSWSCSLPEEKKKLGRERKRWGQEGLAVRKPFKRACHASRGDAAHPGSPCAARRRTAGPLQGQALPTVGAFERRRHYSLPPERVAVTLLL